MEEQLPFESELIARIGWLIRLRWVAVAGAAAAILLAAIWFPGELILEALLGVAAGIALYNLAFFVYLRTLTHGAAGAVRLRHATPFACVQIIFDLVALATLLHFAGGIENPMMVFFVFHVIIASILLPRRISYVMTGLAVVMVVSLVGLESAGVLAHHHLPILNQELYQEPLYLITSVGVLAFTLFLVAHLTTSITARLRERDGELWASNLTCQVRSSELEDLNLELRRIDAERTRFMVLVTHELRAPIATIYSALELALGEYASPEKTREVLGRAQTRAGELLSLIGDLLDLTKVRRLETRPEETRPIQPAEVLGEVVDFTRHEAEVKEISLAVEVEPHLAPVRIERDQIKLVWTNLLSNAIKYNELQGSIKVSLRQDEKYVIGSVCDTGIGIATEELPKIFDEFYRADNARRVSPHGSGVGLSIVQRVIEYWGGSIQIESQLGRGTCFTFRLPRADL